MTTSQQTPAAHAANPPDFSDPTQGSLARAREMASESVKSIADPAPLGLACFALTTFLLSLVNAGILPKTSEPVVMGVALFYGGAVQILAGMWEFRKGNVFGATAFSSYGAFWLSFWAWYTIYAAEIPEADRAKAAGWYLVAWGMFTVIMVIASLRTTVLLSGLFTILAVTFFLLAFGALAGSATLTKTGGYFGIVTALWAFLLCLAGVAAATFGKPIIPNRSLAK
ncbi:acetate uptake transporter [Nakamurella sp. GG22]